MKKKYKNQRLLYFCRYSLIKFPDRLLNSSYAGKKKIDGVCNSFDIIGIRPILFVTPNPRQKNFWNRASIHRSDRKIIIIPWSISLRNQPKATYLINLLLSFLFVIKFPRKRFLGSLVYNFMPDSIVPNIAFTNKNKRLISLAEIEEDLSCDVDAPIMFRWFDWCSRKVLRFDGAIVSTINLLGNVNARVHKVICGFVSDTEIEKSIGLCCRRPGPVNILFLGRIDKMRCIQKFLSAVKEIISLQASVSISVIGYPADRTIVDEVKSEVENLSRSLPINLKLSVDASEVESALAKSDICVSVVDSIKFLEKSFPSKLIEFLLYNKIIVSQPVRDLLMVNNIVEIQSSDVMSIRDGLHRAIAIAEAKEQGFRNGHEWVIANCTSKTGAEKILNLLHEID